MRTILKYLKVIRVVALMGNVSIQTNLMAKKTAPINILVEVETKKKLKDKADQMGISITQFIEKIAQEDIVFLDANFKRVAKLFNLK
jgi:hypothetical protein